MTAGMRNVGGSKFVYCHDLPEPDAAALQEQLTQARADLESLNTRLQAEIADLRAALWQPVEARPEECSVEVCQHCESLREDLGEALDALRLRVARGLG